LLAWPSTTLLDSRFMLVSCLAYFSPLKMEASGSYETSVDFQRTTRRSIPERMTLHLFIDPPRFIFSGA
jgi:hypothetical protein